MAIGQTDRETLRFKPEATGTGYGAVATGNYYNLRFNSEALKYNLMTEKSKEITAYRGPRDIQIVDANGEGPVATELSYGEYDELIQAALATTAQNVVGTNGAATGTGTFSATGLTITGAGTPFTNAASGQWIGVLGATNTGNNKFVQITAASTTGITVASGTFTAETGTTGIVVSGTRFINGNTKKSFSIERANPDLSTTGLNEAFRGMVVNNWSGDLKPGGLIGMNFDFVGKDALPMSTGSAFSGTGVSSLTNRIMNSVSNVSNITEGGSSFSNTYVKSLSWKVSNGVEGLDALGNLGNVDFRLGEFAFSMQIGLYLADATYYNKQINNTSSSFSWRMSDASGNGYVVTIPTARYSTAERPNPGRNQVMMLNLNIEAIDPSNTGQFVIIDRCGTAVTPWS